MADVLFVIVIDLGDPCGKFISSPDNLTIETQADANAFRSCTKINANLVIDKDFPGEFTSNLESAYVGSLLPLNVLQQLVWQLVGATG